LDYINSENIKVENKKNYKAIHELIIAVKDSSKLDEISRGTEKGRNLSDATNLARDLTNEPANFLTPDAFAKEAERVAKENDIKITVLGKDEIKEANMHALLAVNAGSHEPPRFVIMEYNGASPDSKVLGLVGKGVTFDSGGLSIKPSDSMFRMHCDMAGAAAVLGAIKKYSKTKIKNKCWLL
jgi:leucyl aminopeptidase